jgi:cytochrome c
MHALRTTLTGIALLAAATGAWAQDAQRGKTLADQCLACHTFSADEEPGPGPSLAGIAGAKAGTRPDFEYSDAFQAAKANGLIWTDAALDRFLANPQGEVPRNKMAYPGIANAGERADIIAYLKTLK